MIAENNVGKFKILSYLWQNAEVIVSIEDELGISRFPACFTLNTATVLPSGKRKRFSESVPACRAARVLTIKV